MPRESKASKQQRAIEVCKRLMERYPGAECALNYDTPFTLLIAVMLSAQTTDAAVNKVTPALFEAYPTPFEMAQASQADVEEIIHSLGFFRSKARHVIKASQMLVAEFDGEVPSTMEELTLLPGVGRKTANIVMNDAFGIIEGIAVDTHVFRVSHKLKLSSKDDPSKVEQDLLAILPKKYWEPANHLLVLFGREICDAKKPRCAECPLSDICPSCKA
jgi:endonuclease III